MMFNESRNERYYCRNADGRDLFFIDLVIDDELFWMYMNSSLNYNFTDNDTFKEMQIKITDFHLSESLRSNLIEQLFNFIKSIPGIEKFYFGPEYLDKGGKHVPEYSAVIENLLQHKDFPDYTVFSKNINSFYFDYSLLFLCEISVKETVKPIDKINFENLIKNDIILSQEYVEWLSDKSEFFHVFLFDQKTQYDCFVMMEEKEIKLFFVRQAILLHL